MGIKTILAASALLFSSIGNAETVVPSNYMIAGKIGDTWDYVRLDSSQLTLTLSEITTGPNAGRFERGNIDTGIVYDQAGNVLTIYEIDKNPLIPPLAIGEIELGQVVGDPADPLYLFWKVPSITVQAGTFNDVLAWVFLDGNFSANSVNTQLGLDPLITAAVTDVNYFVPGFGEVKYQGVDALTGNSDGLGYELVSTTVRTPICDIELSQAIYVDGETVTANTFRLANLTANPIATEIKIWLGVPGVPPIPVINVGSDGSLVLAPDTDIDLGPLPFLPVTAALPRGSYEFSCRMLDPVTGELLTEDRNFFSIITPQNETPTMATRYFPLAIGNIWQYFVTINESNGNSFTEYTYKNSNKIVTFNSSAVYNVKNDIITPDGENENFFYSKWDEGIYFHGVLDPDADDQGFSIAHTYTPPELYLKSTFNINDTWSTTSDVNIAVDGNVIETSSVTSNFMVMAIEDVTVPAGTFQNCYKISIVVSSINTEFNENKTIWLAENVGVVKAVSSTIDFNSTQELQYSNIGGTVHGQEVIN